MPNISAGEGSIFAFFDPAAFLPFGDFALGDLDGGGAGAFLCGPNEARLTDLAAKAFLIGVASDFLTGVFFAGDFTACTFLTGVFFAGDATLIGVASDFLTGAFLAGDFTAIAFWTGVFFAGDFAAFATAFFAGIFVLLCLDFLKFKVFFYFFF
jgi:hypothetical protein